MTNNNQAQNKFDRFLSPALLAALQPQVAPKWWMAMAADEDLFIAPRDGYLNVYYRGNSLVKLTAASDGSLVGEVNYKYLLRPDLKDCLWRMTHDGQIVGDLAGQVPLSDFFHDLNDLEGLKKASKRFAGVEKEGVARIAARQSNVIDLEVAFGSGPVGNGKAEIPRLDLVALHSYTNKKAQDVDFGQALVFYEAKHYSNPELRASGSTEAPVVAQMKKYAQALSDRRHQIVEAYRAQCEYILRTQYASDSAPKVGDMSKLGMRRRRLESIVKYPEKLYLALLPRLLIYGFDEAQKMSPGWMKHVQKLKDSLAENRVIARGDAAEIRLEGVLPLDGEVWKPSGSVEVSALGQALRNDKDVLYG
ncbi:hypothetical protein SAMN05446927_4293 [Caballeronia arationis]|uniref:Uncharacterized protein n=1 Tax=Caballeronia arationis TaxID=1777142 RepID=A0A7Z7I836_9BURK|nr:hypothetical protein [Caballeronia arationis]SOE81038.1 hypothetical protein SAMN05446927_4293 [Caballeronia arationis]